MTREQAITNVVNYLLDDERRHYEELVASGITPTNHIYLSLRQLQTPATLHELASAISRLGFSEPDAEPFSLHFPAANEYQIETEGNVPSIHSTTPA